MDLTKNMVALMAKMRRERNGAVADSMVDRGCASGLNYGVSLPTVRKIARELEADHDFARLLWQQDVREMRLSALYVADPQRFIEEGEFWLSGIKDGELAEEVAFALIKKIKNFAPLFKAWCEDDRAMVRYAALLGAARHAELSKDWCEDAMTAVGKAGDALEEHLVAQAAVSMLAAVAELNGDAKRRVQALVEQLGDSHSEQFIREELAWRLEC